MDSDKVVRDHVLVLLRGGNAHVTFDKAVADVPTEAMGRTIPGMPHSPWALLEHLRIAQWDILEFSRSKTHRSPAWPDGYWPKSSPSAAAWIESVEAFKSDHAAMCKLVSEGDLYTPFPWGDGQTLLREALLVADHNAYHVGQLLTVRRALGVWHE